MSDNPALQGSLALIGRLLLAAMFILSGFGKLGDPSGTIGYIASAGLPLPPVAYAIALVVEIGAGILLVLGYRARWVALILAAFTLASAIGFHTDFADQNMNSSHPIEDLTVLSAVARHFAGHERPTTREDVTR